MVPDTARPGSDQLPSTTAPATGLVGRLGRPNASNVIKSGIWASQKLSTGSLLNLLEFQDPRTLGYLLIFGLYPKPIAYYTAESRDLGYISSLA